MMPKTILFRIIYFSSAFSSGGMILPPAISSHNTTCQIIKENGTWNTAQNACRGNYTNLVTVYTEEDNKKLADLIRASVPFAWIGLYRNQSTEKWSNGDPYTFQNLPKVEKKSCCGAMKSDGSWTCHQCKDKKPFMCYKEGMTYNEFTYHFINEEKTWYEAQSYCRKNFTDLVGIRDDQQNTEVNKNGSRYAPFWIGLLRDEWQWADGGRSAYRNWNPISNGANNQNCVTMGLRGEWNQIECIHKKAALCYLRSDTTPTRPAESRLMSFHPVKAELNQSEARAACKINYTDLVTVYSEEDNSALVGLINEAGVNAGWIGLGLKQELSKKWSNGDPVEFTDMAGYCTSSGPCCFAMKSDGKWDSLQCTPAKPFMCFQQDANGKPKYYLVCEYKNWFDAQQYCRKHYTDLVSITSPEQNEAVRLEGSKITVPFWIGLLSDMWQWVDEGRSAYRNWNVSISRKYSCVKITTQTWCDEDCNSHHSALCYHTHIYLSNYTMTWEKALDYCSEGNRSGLVEIEDEISQKVVERWLRKENATEPVWVGLRQSQLFGFWFWPSGNTVSSWANWYGGTQPEHELSHNCGAIEPERGFKWSDKNCDSKFKVLCFIRYHNVTYEAQTTMSPIRRKH